MAVKTEHWVNIFIEPPSRTQRKVPFFPVLVEDFQGCTKLSGCERDLHTCMLIIHGDRVQHLPIQCKELTHGKDITYGKFQADLRGLCGPLIYFGCVNPWAPTVKLADLKHPPCLLSSHSFFSVTVSVVVSNT